MSQKQIRHGSPGVRAAKGGGLKKEKGNSHKPTDSKFKENVVKKLYDSFQHSFDLDLIASVAHTCQWDLGRSTEALMILGGTKKGRNSKGGQGHNDVTKNKTKSLPSTLKSQKVEERRGSGAFSSPNGLRQNPVHSSTSSLSSGQVWQRHYKSKPQSPGLLTMIPPVVKLKKTGSARSLPPLSSCKQHKESPIVKKTSSAILRIQQLVQNGMKVMILMRGVPGSGKTHLAQVVAGLVTTEFSHHIFSTDDYFVMMGRGAFAYDSNQLAQAHSWNQKRVLEALRRETNPVVVDNTNTQAWEMKPYVVMAVNNGYLIEILEPVTPWRTKEAELARRNVHSVPREKIRQMLDRYEPNWTGDRLLQLFGLKYQQCGLAHIPHEVASFSNSPLAQHRQNVIEIPEKPKRKRNSPSKKGKALVGVKRSEGKEKQLEELNKLFAEYGRTVDEESRRKVLDSGVPISEVVSRIRKLQGNILPLPSNTVPASTMPESSRPRDLFDKPVPVYGPVRRESPSESVEPDTMSSSNVSESSEYETDSDAELAMVKDYIKYGCEGRFVEGEDAWEDEDEDETRAKSASAIGGKPSKLSSLVTSSQEELSLLDFETSTTPAGSSQEELSLIDFDGDVKDASSSSSEEQETQLLTLQESLKEVLINNYERRMNLEKEEKARAKEEKRGTFQSIIEETRVEEAVAAAVEVSEAMTDNFSIISNKDGSNVILNDSLIEMLMKKYDIPLEQVGKQESKKSPDLEEIPLPCVPPGSSTSAAARPPAALPTSTTAIDNLLKTWEYSSDVGGLKDHTTLKPQRLERGAVKKTTGMERDKSPEEVLRSSDLAWSSIPFTGSWDKIDKMPLKADAATNTYDNDFKLWRDESDGLARLVAYNRNINAGYVAVSQLPPRVHALDKSSMVTEADLSPSETGTAVEELLKMFPDIPKDDVVDLLNHCQGDVAWVVELLLEGAPQCPVPPKPPQEPKPCEEEVASLIGDFENLLADGKKTIKRRKDRKNNSSELSLLLKKQIEEGIHIGEDHYQDKTLFIKKLRHGEINLDEPEVPAIDFSTECEPTLPQVPVSQDDLDDEPLIPMQMDTEFYHTLLALFSPSGLRPVEGSTPVVHIPMQLAHQIYGCYIESMNQMVEEMELSHSKMVQDDELLARALQEQEHEAREPGLQEIMDLELAKAISKKDQETDSSHDTIASKLKLSILSDHYPHISQQTLINMLRNVGNSLQLAQEQLALQEPPRAVNVNQVQPTSQAGPSGKPKVLNYIDVEAGSDKRVCSQKTPLRKPIIVLKQGSLKKPETDMLVLNPAEFRQETTQLHEKYKYVSELSKEAISKKNYEVASYYSRVTSFYKDKLREATQHPIKEKLFEKYASLPAQIDLHFLFVPEALEALDQFLDHHISLLAKRGQHSCDVFVITGWGQRSRNNVSKLKPAMKLRLDERSLNYSESNPGMLKVVLHRTDAKASDV